MKYFKEFIGSIICISGLATSVYAANPASKEYVDSQDQKLQTQINNILPGTTYTAGTGIGISNNIITNTLPGVTYTGGTGISVSGSVITNSSPGITYTGGNGINVSGTTISATTGVAEFIRIIQAPNNSVPPGTAFTIDTTVLNTIGVVASAGNGGTVFTLAAGTYVIDYEMSLAGAGSIGLYTGPSAGSLSLDTNTVAGALTAVGTASIATAGTDVGSYMVRLTILKIA